MSQKSFVIVASALILFALSCAPRIVSEAQASECAAGEKIDNSTADSAMKKMTQAGYLQIHDLKKGCDNFWHGKATKDGAAVNIVLSPQGKVMTEGN
jgi:hypothetical protein